MKWQITRDKFLSKDERARLLKATEDIEKVAGKGVTALLAEKTKKQAV